MIGAIALASVAIAALPVTAQSAPASQPLAKESASQVWLHTAERPFPENPGGYARYTDIGMSSIIGTGSIIGLYLTCTPAVPACAGDRPAELHKISDGDRTIVTSGVLADFGAEGKVWDTYQKLQESFPTVDTSTTASLAYEYVLPAWGLFPALRSNIREFEVRRATTARFTVLNGAWEAYGYAQGVLHYCVRKTTDKVPTIVMKTTPARSARVAYYVYGEDQGRGDRVITERIVSDRRGVFRFPGPNNHADSRLVRVPAIKGLSGIAAIFDPCSPP